jgi:hypothetical protein
MTWGTAFFYLNRYTALLGAAPILAEVLLTTTDPSKAAVCILFYRWLILHIYKVSGVPPFKGIVHIFRGHHATLPLAVI